MQELIMQLFNGISLSSILFLSSVGLAITFGLMGVINMAHGEFIMIGAYTTYIVQNVFIDKFPNLFNYYIFFAVVFSFLVSSIIGYLLERLIICHLYGRIVDSLLVTWGISLVLQQLARSIFGAPNVSVRMPGYLQGNIHLTDNIVFPNNRIFILFLALVCLVLIYILMYRSRYGRNVLAVMQNREMAASLGISTRRVDSLTFAIGSGLAGIAGCAITWIGAIGPTIGTSYIIDSFVAVVAGGAGTIVGTIFGASFIGIGETVFEFLTTSSIGKVLIFTCVIILLQFRPKGLFAIKTRVLDD
ncbi:urea ABC transporter permease subunit UrtB [Sporolactobacillus terrae]|uniref:urea ABC transporter permease subunit UrtB n=1 Tax=Sporolactobacillus terrae TaxID=269673 RepID=UPI001118F891|nr:urea ABC transporter permease subunit UrtB [Sporolactobacillus terrae]